LQAGAAAAFLRDLLLCQDCPSVQLIERDLLRCLELHFRHLHAVVPPLMDGQQQQQQQQAGLKMQSSAASSLCSRTSVASASQYGYS
jgi:hypothetical protein